MAKTAITLFLLCAASADLAVAQSRPDIRRARRPIPDQYVVVLAADDPVAVAAQAASLFGGRVKHVYRNALRGFAIRMNAVAAAALASDPRVQYVEEDGRVDISDIQVNPPWGLDRIDGRTLPLDGVYEYPVSATPVYVHVVDTGIRPSHVEFAGRAFIAGDYVDDDNDGDPLDVGNDDADPSVPDGADCHGHGTHVAGTIGGATYGVAKNVLLYSYRTLDCTGEGANSSIIAALDDITADVRRPAVANLSLGGFPSNALDDAVRRSIAAGVTYVIAAGNDGIDARDVSPGRVVEAITVGATNSNDVKPSWSNFGPGLDIFAPGVSVDSAWHTSDTAVARASGTSMATPHAAGVAALYLGQVGNRSPLEVRDAMVLAGTAGVVGSPGVGSPNLLVYSGVATTGAAARVNVALATNGATATASSTASADLPPAAVINGDRLGLKWSAGGGWADGTPNVFPDWIEIAFNGTKTIDEVAVFSRQDNFKSPSPPTPTMTFSLYGAIDFTVQYWTGSAWTAVPGGVIRGNALVWRSVPFPAVTTSRIRVLVERAADNRSRLVEVEAYQATTSAPPNAPPTVGLTAPATGSVFAAPADILLSADASDADGSIAHVAFYSDAMLIGTDSSAPYTLTWTDVASGAYRLTAVATDDAGATTTSDAVDITVTSGATRMNVALAATGATATASSTASADTPPAAVINGDRLGLKWSAGGGWADGTPNVFPDWLEIAFNGTKTIDEVAVFSRQDNFKSPSPPTPTMTFSLYGAIDFTVQYWTGSAWTAVPGGVIRGNALVWRSVSFPAVTTSGIRVLVERAADNRSRLAEVEAYEASTTMTEWFVAPGGTGSGTSAAPMGRIQDALNAAQPGDVITVRRGTYSGALRTVRAGAPGQPIRLRAAEGRGSVVVTAAGRVLTVDHAYLTVEDLVLDGQYGADDTVRVASTGDYFTLRNAEVRRSSRDLIDMGGPDGVLIEDALLHHALNAAGGRTDAHGIAAGAVRDLTVRRTEIHTFSGDGLQVDPGRAAPGWTRVTIEGSRIWLAPLPTPENGFAAGVVPGENAVDTKASPSLPRAILTIRDTVAFGFRDGLISNMAAFNLKEHVDVTLDRITVFDSEIAFRLRGPTATLPAGAWVTVMNAVIYNVATAFRYENNIEQLRIWNSTLGLGIIRPFQPASSTAAGLDVRNLLSIPPLSSEATTDPSNLQVGTGAFVNAAAHDYALAAGSPAVDAGATIPAVSTDRAGLARPQGARYDVGAYERAAGSP